MRHSGLEQICCDSGKHVGRVDQSWDGSLLLLVNSARSPFLEPTIGRRRFDTGRPNIWTNIGRCPPILFSNHLKRERSSLGRVRANSTHSARTCPIRRHRCARLRYALLGPNFSFGHWAFQSTAPPRASKQMRCGGTSGTHLCSETRAVYNQSRGMPPEDSEVPVQRGLSDVLECVPFGEIAPETGRTRPTSLRHEVSPKMGSGKQPGLLSPNFECVPHQSSSQTPSHTRAHCSPLILRTGPAPDFELATQGRSPI